MIMLLALPVIAAVTFVHGYLLLYAPSNILVRRARASGPSLSAVAAVLSVAGGLIVAMRVTSDAVAAGAPGWLNLVILVLAWDAIKLGLLAILVIGRCARPHLRRLHRTDMAEPERDASDQLPASRRTCREPMADFDPSIRGVLMGRNGVDRYYTADPRLKVVLPPRPRTRFVGCWTAGVRTMKTPV